MDDVGIFSCRYYATVVWEGAGFEATSVESHIFQAVDWLTLRWSSMTFKLP